jgi:hypothetical protein
MSSFGDMLRAAGSNDLIEPPKGKYDVKIADGTANDTKIGPRVGITLEILAGEHQGARFEHAMFFNHPVGTEINKEALVSYGVDLNKIEEVEDLNLEIDRIMGTTAEVGVSYNDRGYIQIKVHGSRPPAGDTDIPSDPDTARMTPAQETTFKAASQRFGDSVPF